MSFILLAQMRAAEGKTQELIDHILPIVEDSRKEKGCLQYQFSQSQDDPRVISIWEEYDSEESFTAFEAKISTLLEGELSLKKYNVLDRFH